MMIFQYVIIGVLALLALIYLLRKYLPVSVTGKKSSDCNDGNCGCG